jgi:two-component system, chemotaxis family, protein-glutamate methylesterase/glutaminase
MRYPQLKLGMLRRDIVVIAASLGGVRALCRLAQALSPQFPGSILAVQHTAASSPGALAEIIQRQTSLTVSYARSGALIRAGHIYLAPPDRHLLVSSQGRMVLSDAPKVNHVRPAADLLFETAANYFGQRVVGVVLTGRDGDGAQGLKAITKAKGVRIVQHPAEAEAAEMPMHALNGDSPEFSVSVAELAPLLHALAEGRDGHDALASHTTHSKSLPLE